VTFRHVTGKAASRLLGGLLLATPLAVPVVASEVIEDAPVAAVVASAVVTSGQIEIAVDGTQARVGMVRVNLYASKEAFLEREDAQAEVAVADQGASVVTFTDLAPGTYAAVAYQDINGNGELDRGLFGIPLEPLGFSNGVVPVFSAPDFEDAAVIVADGLTEIGITVRNLTSARRAGS